MDLKEFDALLHDAEVKLKRLKALYEQWFQGIERIEPSVARKDLERLFALLAKDKPRNTAARFRLQQLNARYAIYLTYWGRIARQIEEGTYERDVRRANRARGAATVRASTKAYELDLEEEIALDDVVEDEIASVLKQLEAPSPAPVPKKPALSAFSPFALGSKKKVASPPSPPKAPAAAPKPPPPPPPPRPPAEAARKPVTATFGRPKAEAKSAEDPSLRRLYESYVSARRRNNESVDGVAYDKVAASVRQMQSKLRERHGDKRIDFEVVVQNGKVGIKPKIG